VVPGSVVGLMAFAPLDECCNWYASQKASEWLSAAPVGQCKLYDNHVHVEEPGHARALHVF